uniref:Vesicle trafficking 1 n=1 Tax=Cyanistes caeruleus TaxID=156563 RepID=A0A8C0UT54_CYACU
MSCLSGVLGGFALLMGFALGYHLVFFVCFVSFQGRLYAMQTGMKIDSKTPECRKFLSKLMDQLEAMKKQFGDNEAITQEIVGSAHVENYALKMFLYADNEDRAGQFHKNMIKSFYTASLLIDVLTVFGELSEENAQHRKYARWKAAYIHNCLKNGETPQPGPIGMEGESFADAEREEAGSSSAHSGTTPSSSSTYEANNIPTSNYTGIHIPPGAHAPANTPAEVPHNTGVTSNTIQPAAQNIPLVDPSLYSAQSAGKLMAFVLLYMDILCPLCLPWTEGRSSRNPVTII